MPVVSTLLFVVVWGLAIGAGACWLVPGPDPMPPWLTIAIGVAGSLVGLGVVLAVLGLPANAGEAYIRLWPTIGLSLVGSAGLVVAYRRFVQKRAVFGREAHRMPTHGIGVARARRRLGFERDVAHRLRVLAQLKEDGLITDEEFAAKRAELISAI